MSKIIGLLGHSGSGKDTVAKIAAEFCDCASVSMADPLKKICKEVFDFTDLQLYGPSENRNAPDTRYPRQVVKLVNLGESKETGYVTTYLTPRYALQTLGTEWGRNCYDNIWADLGVRRAKKMLATVREVSGKCNECGHSVTDKVPCYNLIFITDVRFVNEAKLIRENGGEIWKIDRPGFVGVIPGGVSDHASESAIDGEKMGTYVSRTISNGGSLDLLKDLVHNIVDLVK